MLVINDSDCGTKYSTVQNSTVRCATDRCDAGGHVQLGELRGPQLAVQLRVPPLDLGQLLLQRRDHALGARHLASRGQDWVRCYKGDEDSTLT